MMSVLGRSGLLLVALWSLSACSGLDLGEARKLGQGGMTASTTLRDEARQAKSDVDSWRELGRPLNIALIEGGEPERSPGVDKSSERLAKALAARTRAMEKLLATYTAFDALARYDAVGETEKAVGSFIDETNGFVQAVQQLGTSNAAAGIPLVDPQVAEGIRIVFGVIAEEVQKRKVAKASHLIRESVDRLAKAVAAEKLFAVEARRKNLSDRQMLRAKLFAGGIASRSEDLKRVFDDLRIKPVADLDAAISRAPTKVRAGMQGYLAYLDKRDLAHVPEAYDELVGLLEGLVKQHAKLEEGAKVDLEDIKAWVERLAKYYKRVKDAKGASEGG